MNEDKPLEICVNYEAAKLVPANMFGTIPESTIVDTLTECRFVCNGYKVDSGCYIPISQAPKDYLQTIKEKYQKCI